MTKEQEADIDNALLTLMYEWKIGTINQSQALKEFKQCMKYYAFIENVMEFKQDDLVDVQRFEHYGEEKTIERVKQDMSKKIIAEVVKKGCISFEEVPMNDWPTTDTTYRRFKMIMDVIIPKNNQQ